MMTFSQQTGLTEKDIISNAQSLFDKKDYQAAMPLYAQLVSVHPDDPQFNYRFGVCTLFGDRKDKKKPIRYLNNAVQTIKDNQELYYYLGMAYHQNQEFANAMKYFNLYLAKLSSNAPERASVLEKVNACLNGLNLSNKNLVSEIVSTSKFQKDNFHRAYEAQDFNGSLMIKPEIFVSDKERKSGENSFVYLIQPSNVLYFSGYTGIGNNRDIFKVEMDENGDWGIPEKAGETINTSFDENYPVLVDNGNTLYFCSKGHNSLGGYDIFRSTLDPVTKVFKQPENLGPGINSPFDDIVFIPARDDAYAYFASDRDNLNGSINVYKIRLIDNAFAEGLILAENNDDAVNQTGGNSNVTNNNSENVASNSSSYIALQQNDVKQPLSDPSKKAASMVNDRSKCMALADSAFTIISATKELIRDLTNRRDRANAISVRKSNEAKTVEERFIESITQLANAANEEQFLQDIEKSVKLKEDVYQLQQRSNLANKIAWNLGNQVKIKDQELNNLKTLASKIQSTSVSSTFEETLVLFSSYKKILNVADTLADYTDQLMAITNDKTTFNVPQSELAFADNLKKAYKNNTLLAEMNNGKTAFDEKVPIVVVDKSTNVQESSSLTKPQQKPVVLLAIVEPVVFSASGFASMDPGNELLKIDFGIDNRTNPMALVESINYSANAINLIDKEYVELEISFNVDKVALADIYPLIEPVYSSAFKTYVEPNETSLALNFEIDAIKAVKLVEPVQYAYANQNYNEEIEISYFTDKIELSNIAAIIEPVYIRNLAMNDLPGEATLELNFAVDESKAEKLVQPVKVSLLAQNFNDINEELEMSNFNDKTEQVIISALIQPVYSDNLALNFDPAESALELSFGVDQIKSEGLVEQVQMTLLAYEQIIIDQDIEIENSSDVVKEVEIAKVIEPLTFHASPSVLAFLDESLEINFNSDGVKASKLVEPISYNENISVDIAYSEPELDLNMDQPEALRIIEPISANLLSFNEISPADDEIELSNSIDRNGVVAFEIIQMVAYKETTSLILKSEPKLDINFAIDQASEAMALIEPVFVSYRQTNSLIIENEAIEISFNNDLLPATEISTLSAKNLKSSDIAINNIVAESVEHKLDDRQAASADEIYFLRESVMQPNEIESSKSDNEILAKAMKNLDELSYEELLYAANLTDVLEEKMAIYNLAFVHIDRDWRAFNNAAVSAIHLEDLSKANCYLYQASLLSADNGYIQNNMGILACHQNKFDKAEEYFIAASNLGYDAQYNLHLANNLSDLADSGKTDSQVDLRNSGKTRDAVVDIIDYKATDK